MGVDEERIASIGPADDDDFHDDKEEEDIVELVKKETGKIGLKRRLVFLVCVCLEDEERVGDYLMERWVFIAE